MHIVFTQVAGFVTLNLKLTQYFLVLFDGYRAQQE